MRSPASGIQVLITILAIVLSGCMSGYAPGIPRADIVEGDYGDSVVTVIPGAEYEAGRLHRIFFGGHYRDLWAAPIQVEVLDLEHAHGGLTPVEAGGGFQTKSLRFRAADGSLFKFRSVDKNPRAILPLELQNTVAGDIAKDQISMSHPAGALVVDELAGAVGVPRLHPRLVLLPDSPRLGEYRNDFGGLLGIFETYPDDGPHGTAGFMGSTKIQNTMKMFEAMDDNSEDRPDPIAFLKARFLDVFVGDWDRHVKQWKWARFKERGRDVWYPIPLDRDQAFVHLDGVFPWAASMAISQFENFSEIFNNISKLTFSGRFLDRRILVPLDRPTWDSVMTVFVGELSDSVIIRAVRQLPPPYLALDGDRLINALKSRRDSFYKISDAYYHLLSRYVDVHLSDKRECASIKRVDDGHVEVTAWRTRKDMVPVFHRVFVRGETNEIRLYMGGGDDSVVVEGSVGASIVVRVVGGKGDDVMIDRSEVHGVLWGWVPFVPQPDQMTYFYDYQGTNRYERGPSCSIDERKYTPPPGGTTQY